MDGDRFDQIAKSLASGLPRRGMIKATVATGVAAVLARVGFDAAEAKKPNVLQKCGRNDNNRKCKGQNNGLTKCQKLTKAICSTEFPGKRCCKTEGQVCNNAPPNCECCGDLFCAKSPGSGTTTVCTSTPT